MSKYILCFNHKQFRLNKNWINDLSNFGSIKDVRELSLAKLSNILDSMHIQNFKTFLDIFCPMFFLILK